MIEKCEYIDCGEKLLAYERVAAWLEPIRVLLPLFAEGGGGAPEHLGDVFDREQQWQVLVVQGHRILAPPGEGSHRAAEGITLPRTCLCCAPGWPQRSPVKMD
jgi:hypothetical protein